MNFRHFKIDAPILMMSGQEKGTKSLRRVLGKFDLGDVALKESRRNSHFIQAPGERYVLKSFRSLRLARKNIEVFRELDSGSYFKRRLLLPSANGKFMARSDSNYFFVYRHVPGEPLHTFVRKNRITTGMIHGIIDSVNSFHSAISGLEKRLGSEKSHLLSFPEVADKDLIRGKGLELCREIRRIESRGRFPRRAIHGDMNETNIIANPDGIFCIDFDEVSTGPPMIDIAPALISVIFKHGEIDYGNVAASLKRYGDILGKGVREDAMRYFFHILRFCLFKYDLYSQARGILNKDENEYAGLIRRANDLTAGLEEKTFLRSLGSAMDAGSS